MLYWGGECNSYVRVRMVLVPKGDHRAVDFNVTAGIWARVEEGAIELHSKFTIAGVHAVGGARNGHPERHPTGHPVLQAFPTPDQGGKGHVVTAIHSNFPQFYGGFVEYNPGV